MAADKDIPLALKSTLVDSSGVAYRDFRATLTPRYGRVWRDILIGYSVCIGVVYGLVAWDLRGVSAVAAAVVGATAIGYLLAYLNNFFHEAAHHNLWPTRAGNDIVTNATLGWLFGSSIATYRRIHFQHHRALGTTEDSENSYFDPLRVRYLVEGLLGVKVIRTLRRYRQVETQRPTRSRTGNATSNRSRAVWLGISAVAHFAIAWGLWFLASSPAAAVAWVGGVGLWFPFFASLRQLLEHRSEDADASIDYRLVDHGKVNRLFGDGPVASTLGSAGFNRHALHHWEPNLSYTRLRDVERYLARTDAADLLQTRQTTYSRTFLRLLEL